MTVWRRMLSDNGLDESGLEFDLAWVNRKTGPGMVKKVPYLFCVLEKLDTSSTDPKCVVRDPEGRAEGSIHRDVVDMIGGEEMLRPGAGMALKNVQVVMTAASHYLIITTRF